MSEKMKEDVPEGRNKTDALLLSIARSHGHLGQIANVTTTWKKLCQELSEPSVDNIKTAKFLRLPLEEQHKRKNRGYFVGGPFKGRARKKTEMVNRSVLTFDIDQCGLNLLDELLDPMLSSIAGYEYQVHSTRSHSPEKPRIRLVIPLDKPIPLEQYDPLMRIIAFQLDPTMETVAPESFALPQAMFLPTRSSDQEFINYRNATGKLLSAEEHFKTWPEPWTTYDRLPVSAREMRARRAHDKAPDPRTKPGIIGAWCRTYDIHTVISNFLSDVYVPGDEADRYSYLPGHTRNGAIVYDGGVFLYSHHGTDPCGGKLVNGWDLYRIHKFGHLDSVDAVEVAEGNITKLPSHKAMLEFARTDKVVVRESGAAYYDEDAIIADMLADEDEDEDEVVLPPVKAKDEKWKDQLERYETSGKYLPSFINILLILRNDPRLTGCLGFNEFNSRPVLRRPIRSKQLGYHPVHFKMHGDSIPDHIDVMIRLLLEAPPKEGGYGMKTLKRDIEDAISTVIQENPFHPVKNYLRSLRWDGKPRMRKLLSAYFTADDTPLNEVFSRIFMVAAVQRIFEPGCKFDHVLILRGPQGIRKSGGLRALAGSDFFGELTTPHPEKRETVVEQLTGKWIVEIPELSQFARSDVEVLKALFSAQEDNVRLAYGRGVKIHPRKNVFSGTSNNEKFLKDDTGNRRFWPVVLRGQVDTAAIERDRDQLWAEAFQEYLLLRFDTDHPVLPLNVPRSLQKEVTSIQEKHQEQPYEWIASQISEWLNTPVPEEQAELGWRATDDLSDPSGRQVLRQKTCLRDIAELCLGRSNFDARVQKDIAAAMRSLKGWTISLQQRIPGKPGHGRQTIYIRKKG